MRNIKLAANLPMAVPEIVDITDSLPKAASWESLRKKWVVKGNWDGHTYLTGLRKPDDITCITIHHSGPPNGTLESHARFHASRWGAGIAYHICIDQGRIYQTNDLLSMTYHAGNNNTYTIGIEVNRDLTGNDLTDQERTLLYAAILTVKSLFPTITEIRGHKELPTCATACPVTSMDRIRADILALEEQMQYNASPTAETALLYAFVSRVANLGHTLSGNGVYAPEARRKLMMLSDVPLGITGDVTAEAIVQRVADVWKHYDRYPDEAGRKLNAGAAVYKEKGLLG